MPRYAAQTDRNHKDVIRWFLELGCTVVDLSKVGGGCPDLLVGVRGHERLVETKDPKRKPSERKLRPNQSEFFETWAGSKPAKVETHDDVIEVFRGLTAGRLG